MRATTAPGARWGAVLLLGAGALLAGGMALAWLTLGNIGAGVWALIVTVLTTVLAGAFWWRW